MGGPKVLPVAGIVDPGPTNTERITDESFKDENREPMLCAPAVGGDVGSVSSPKYSSASSIYASKSRLATILVQSVSSVSNVSATEVYEKLELWGTVTFSIVDVCSDIMMITKYYGSD
ncbi:hypothetical protein TrRE_jg3541, partial [Triparma retinervis]